MDTEKQINAAAAYVGMSQAQVAEAVGMSRAAFNSKIKRNTFKDEELENIALVMGAKYEARFVFEDGTRI